MTNALYYAVARFRPLSFTGEFANIGVVVFSPNEKQIAFRLAPKRFRRVTQFFDAVDPEVYSSTIRLLIEELSRLQEKCRLQKGDNASSYFTSFVKQREGVITFGKIHGIVAEDAETTASALYNRYVRRSQEQTAQREFELTKGLRFGLKQAHITSFRSKQIEDDLMPLRLPFVSETQDTMIIKPVAFDQKSTIGVIDHANLWRDRLSYFLEKGRFRRENILIAIDTQTFAENITDHPDDLMMQAKQVAGERLGSLGVPMVMYDPEYELPGPIIDFASRGERHLPFWVRRPA